MFVMNELGFVPQPSLRKKFFYVIIPACNMQAGVSVAKPGINNSEEVCSGLTNTKSGVPQILAEPMLSDFFIKPAKKLS